MVPSLVPHGWCPPIGMASVLEVDMIKRSEEVLGVTHFDMLCFCFVVVAAAGAFFKVNIVDDSKIIVGLLVLLFIAVGAAFVLGEYHIKQ